MSDVHKTILSHQLMKKIEIKIEVSKKFLSVFFLAALLALSGLFLVKTIKAGTLNCYLAASCSGTTLFRMQNTTNSHAGTPAGSSYTNLVCCDGVTGLGANCSGTYQLLGTLSGSDNAHFEDSFKTNYSSTNDICLSVSSGSVSAGTSTSCASYDTTIFSISGASNSGTNTHTATGTGASSYTTKVCATATGGEATSLSFVVSTNNFPNITPGAPVFATSTILVSTNNSSGWNVILYGNDQSPTNTVCDLDSDDTVGLTDQTEWVAPAATSTAGNAVRISSFDSSGDVLAFRLMTASGTVAFRAPTWWGTVDDYGDNANTKWAGIASSSVYRMIGNSNYSQTNSFSTILYYLDVPSSQQNGAYGCPLTISATANP